MCRTASSLRKWIESLALELGDPLAADVGDVDLAPAQQAIRVVSSGPA